MIEEQDNRSLCQVLPAEAMAMLLNGVPAPGLVEEIKGLVAKAYPEIAVPTSRLASADLERAHKQLMRVAYLEPQQRHAEVARAAHACNQMCPECPWRSAPSSAPWLASEQAKLEHHAEHLGGFACHMLDGDERSFHQTERTEHQCMGWKKAGGNVEAIRRRWQPDKPRFLLNAMSSVRIIEVSPSRQPMLDEVAPIALPEFIPPKTFKCPACRRVSHNKKDVQNNYCGACHRFF